jgi:hypothetical protein
MPLITQRKRFVSFFLSRSSPSRLAYGASSPSRSAVLGPTATGEQCPGHTRTLHHHRAAPRPRSAPLPPASGTPAMLGPSAIGERHPSHAWPRRLRGRPPLAHFLQRPPDPQPGAPREPRKATMCILSGPASSGTSENLIGHGRPQIWHW